MRQLSFFQFGNDFFVTREAVLRIFAVHKFRDRDPPHLRSQRAAHRLHALLHLFLLFSSPAIALGSCLSNWRLFLFFFLLNGRSLDLDDGRLLFLLLGLCLLSIKHILLLAFLLLVHFSFLSNLLSFLNALLLRLGLNSLRNSQPTVLRAWCELDDALRQQGHFFFGPAGAVVLDLLCLFGLFLDEGEFSLLAVFLVHHLHSDPLDPLLLAAARLQEVDERLHLINIVEFLLNTLDPEPIVIGSFQFLGTQIDQLLTFGLERELDLFSLLTLPLVLISLGNGLVLLFLLGILDSLFQFARLGSLVVPLLLLFAEFLGFGQLALLANTRVQIVCHF